MDAIYSNILEEIQITRRSCPTGTIIETLQIPGSARTNSQSEIYTIVDTVVNRFGTANMYLLMPPHCQFNADFLNRVRINTIQGYQVFFPIPFLQYNPLVSGRSLKKSVKKSTWLEAKKRQKLGQSLDRWHSSLDSSDPLDVHKNQGHFDANNFAVASFYGSDYAARRAATSVSFDGKRTDLAQTFLGANRLHLLRAPDPALKERYHERICRADLAEDEYSRCLISRKEGLGSKSQIAALVLEAMEQKGAEF